MPSMIDPRKLTPNASNPNAEGWSRAYHIEVVHEHIAGILTFSDAYAAAASAVFF